MIFSASQIVGLIEIETASDSGAECLVSLGLEEQSLGELLAWLTGTTASSAVGDDADLGAVAGATNRLATGPAASPDSVLNADLEQLETDLVDATTRFRQKLTAIARQ